MTVKELKEALECCDDDQEVMFGYDYGDYCHRTKCQPIREVINDTVKYSDRLDGWQFSDSIDPDDERKDVILLL